MQNCEFCNFPLFWWVDSVPQLVVKYALSLSIARKTSFMVLLLVLLVWIFCWLVGQMSFCTLICLTFMHTSLKVCFFTRHLLHKSIVGRVLDSTFGGGGATSVSGRHLWRRCFRSLCKKLHKLRCHCNRDLKSHPVYWMTPFPVTLSWTNLISFRF